MRPGVGSRRLKPQALPPLEGAGPLVAAAAAASASDSEASSSPAVSSSAPPPERKSQLLPPVAAGDRAAAMAAASAALPPLALAAGDERRNLRAALDAADADIGSARRTARGHHAVLPPMTGGSPLMAAGVGPLGAGAESATPLEPVAPPTRQVVGSGRRRPGPPGYTVPRLAPLEGGSLPQQPGNFWQAMPLVEDLRPPCPWASPQGSGAGGRSSGSYAAPVTDATPIAAAPMLGEVAPSLPRGLADGLGFPVADEDEGLTRWGADEDAEVAALQQEIEQDHFDAVAAAALPATPLLVQEADSECDPTSSNAISPANDGGTAAMAAAVAAAACENVRSNLSVNGSDAQRSSPEGNRSAGFTPEFDDWRPSTTRQLDRRPCTRAEAEKAFQDTFMEERTRGASPTAAAAEALRRCCSSSASRGILESRESARQQQVAHEGSRSATTKAELFNESQKLLLKEQGVPRDVPV